MLFIKNILFALGILLLAEPHPFYLSVTDVKHNAKNKTLEIACKMFTNDLEDALKRTSKKTVDLLNPADKKETEKILLDYITKRLTFQVNGKAANLKYIGYEKEDDVIWTYFEIDRCSKLQALTITNCLLYDFLKEQINMVHVEAGNFKQSAKVNYPDKEIKFVITN